MWKNSLKNIESDNGKILYENLLDFSSQRNGTYLLNEPRIYSDRIGPTLQVRFKNIDGGGKPTPTRTVSLIWLISMHQTIEKKIH